MSRRDLIMPQRGKPWWKQPQWWAVIVAVVLGVLTLAANTAMGSCSLKLATTADDPGTEALDKLDKMFFVQGRTEASATLVRNVHELSFRGGREVLWEWYDGHSLSFDVTFKNESVNDATVERVEIFNSEGTSIYSKDLRGEDEEVRVPKFAQRPIAIETDDIKLGDLDERLLLRSACSCVLPGETSCDAERALEITGRVVVHPIGGEPTAGVFELHIEHEPVRSCQKDELLVTQEPTEGCPPQLSPTPSPSPEATPTPQITPG